MPEVFTKFFSLPTQIGLNTKKQYLRNMKKDELKIEIKKIIDKVPDDMLEDIYNVLKEFADKTPDSIKLSHNLNRILTEDKGLLKRLAD